MNKLIIVIGRGHSGTRAISHTLSASGVYMGAPLNESGDLVPAESLYAACRVMARHVRHTGGLSWDFSALFSGPIDPEFQQLLDQYLLSLHASQASLKGWKIPETTLIYPWIARLFPDAYYIHWVRDPRDGILSRHLTDDLADFCISYPKADDIFEKRAISWKYQVGIVKATPRPKRFLSIRFEDFVLSQEPTVQTIESFLGLPLVRIPVRTDSVGRWRQQPDCPQFPFWEEELEDFGYI